VAFIVVLLGFLGMAIYTGLNAYVQSELQSAASTASMVGASAYYDGPITGTPETFPATDNPDRARQAATQVFNMIVSNSPVLRNMRAQLEPGANGVVTNNGDDSVQVNAQATIPTPFLSLLGVESFQVTANGRAGYVKRVYQGPGKNGNVYPATPGLKTFTINLSHPLTDGPGPDLKITHRNRPRGYMVEACSGSGGSLTCYDITDAATVLRFGIDGAEIRRTFPTANPTAPVQRRVVYGTVLIDLANAPGDVRKATAIRLIDDGIPDHFEGGVHKVEVAPGLPLSEFEGIEVFHHATTCAANTTMRCQNRNLRNQGFYMMTDALPP
jgi:hypothetical protein